MPLLVARGVLMMETQRLEVIDPHCVPVTPVDYICRVDFLPGNTVLVTMTKTQSSCEGGLVRVITARIEWPLALFRAALRQCEYAVEAGQLATLKSANVLAS